jgi:hypothetical protein
MSLRNITPSHLRCSFGGCPAVFEDGPAHLVIVGTVVTSEPDLSGKVGPDECAIRISREMFAGLAANGLMPGTPARRKRR